MAAQAPTVERVATGNNGDRVRHRLLANGATQITRVHVTTGSNTLWRRRPVHRSLYGRGIRTEPPRARFKQMDAPGQVREWGHGLQHGNDVPVIERVDLTPREPPPVDPRAVPGRTHAQGIRAGGAVEHARGVREKGTMLPADAEIGEADHHGVISRAFSRGLS